jgi:hypothetical protein
MRLCQEETRKNKPGDLEHFNGRLLEGKRYDAHYANTVAIPAPADTPILVVLLGDGLGLLLRCADVCVVHLCRELKTCDRLLEMSLQWADHDEHEGFRVAAEGVLE